MNLFYLGELTLESSDLADLLRAGDDHDVTFVSSAFEVAYIADGISGEIIIIFETAYADEARKLGTRFAMVEFKPGMRQTELLNSIDLARQDPSTRK
jgi:hypothetical protein